MHLRPPRCQGSLYSFWVQENEFKDLEKPDGLRFVRGAQFERFRNGLITPRSLVLLLYKGAWNRDRGKPHGSPLPHHRTCGSASGGSFRYDEVGILVGNSSDRVAPNTHCSALCEAAVRQINASSPCSCHRFGWPKIPRHPAP